MARRYEMMDHMKFGKLEHLLHVHSRLESGVCSVQETHRAQNHCISLHVNLFPDKLGLA
jgi:hypothetical protein